MVFYKVADRDDEEEEDTIVEPEQLPLPLDDDAEEVIETEKDVPLDEEEEDDEFEDDDEDDSLEDDEEETD